MQYKCEPDELEFDEQEDQIAEIPSLLQAVMPAIIDYDGGIEEVINRLDGEVTVATPHETFSEQLAYGLRRAGVC